MSDGDGKIFARDEEVIARDEEVIARDEGEKFQFHAVKSGVEDVKF